VQVTARLLLDMRDELQPVEVLTHIMKGQHHSNYHGHTWANTFYTMPPRARSRTCGSRGDWPTYDRTGNQATPVPHTTWI